jgi:hypothetical protein
MRRNNHSKACDLGQKDINELWTVDVKKMKMTDLGSVEHRLYQGAKTSLKVSQPFQPVWLIVENVFVGRDDTKRFWRLHAGFIARIQGHLDSGAHKGFAKADVVEIHTTMAPDRLNHRCSDLRDH